MAFTVSKALIELLVEYKIETVEEKHKQRLLSNFPGELKHKDLFVLDIPDNYRFMDPELIQELETAVTPILNRSA